MKRLRWCLIASVLALSGCRAPPAEARGEGVGTEDPAAPSLYDLPLTLIAQDGRPFTLADHRGHPVLITMFYGSCPQACPMLIADLRAIDKQLDAASRARLRIVLVSLDPVHDTPDTLRVLARNHGVDLARWSFASAREPDVRTLAAALGLAYRELPDGSFSHSSVITLLDGRGVVAARIEGLRQPSGALRERAITIAGRP
jgi:protein SCO1/2